MHGHQISVFLFVALEPFNRKIGDMDDLRQHKVAFVLYRALRRIMQPSDDRLRLADPIFKQPLKTHVARGSHEWDEVSEYITPQ
jgi:hypothetical protein